MKTVLLFLSLFFFFTFGRSSTITKIKSFNTDNSPTSSLYGGSILEIRGEDVNPSGSTTISITVGDLKCEENLYLRSSSRLVCTIEETIQEEGSLLLSLEVNGENAQCEATNGCYVEFSESKTPYILEYYPMFITQGETFSIKGVFGASSYYDLMEISSSSLRLVEASDTTTLELSSGSIRTIYMSLPSHLMADKHFIQFRGGSGSGYNRNTSYTGDFDVVLVSEITSISQHYTTSYGLAVIITGTSFNPDDQELYLGEVQCNISIATPTELKVKCLDETQEVLQKNSEGEINIAGYGVKVERYSEDGTLLEEVMLPSFEGRKSTTAYKEVYTAFFKPEYSNIYSFMFRGSGDEKVKFSLGSPVSNSGDLSDLSYDVIFVYSDSKNEYKGFLSKYDTWKMSLMKEELFLTEGEYYPIKVVRTGINTEYFRFGMVESGEDRHPICLPLSFSVSLAKEDYAMKVFYMDIFNVRGGRWQMSKFQKDGETKRSKSFLWNVDPDVIADQLLNEFFSLADVTRTMLTYKGETTEDESELGGYRYIVDLHYTLLSEPFDLPTIEDSTLEAIDQSLGAQTSLTLIQGTSEAVSGQFRLFVESEWTSWMSYDISPEKLWFELVQMESVGKKTKVSASGSPISGYVYLIEFFDEESSEIQIAVDDSRLNTKITLTQDSEYDCKWAEYEAIPFNILFQLSEYPTLYLKSSYGGSMCLPPNCEVQVIDFGWGGEVSSMTFELYSDMANSGTMTAYLTETLVNYNNEISVIRLIMDDSGCISEGPTQNIDEVYCQMEDVVAGLYYVSFQLKSFGFVHPETDTSNEISIYPGIRKITITPGYSNRTTYLEIRGARFNTELTTITIGGGEYSCDIETIDNELIGCKTLAPHDEYLELKIFMNEITVVFSDGFHIETESTPMVSSLSQSSSSPVEQVYISVYGENFGDSVDSIHVDLVGFSDSSVLILCLLVNVTDSEIFCYIKGGEQGKYNVFVSREGYGSSNEEIVYEIYSSVSSISPSSGSYEGGTQILIEGENFSPSSSSSSVFIKTKDGSQLVGLCNVFSANTSMIECTTTGILNDDYIDQQVKLVIMIKGQEILVDNEEVLEFVYSSIKTPFVYSVSPLKVTQGESVKIVGKGFSSETDVFVGDLELEQLAFYSDFSDGSMVLNGSFPFMAQNQDISFKVYVPGKGYAEKQHDFTFNNKITVESLSMNYISRIGGKIEIKGNGFSESQRFCFGKDCQTSCCSVILTEKNSVMCVICREETDTYGSYPLVIYDEVGSKIFDCEEQDSYSVCTLQLLTTYAPTIKELNQSIFESSYFGVSVTLSEQLYIRSIFSDMDVQIILYQDISSYEDWNFPVSMSRDEEGLVFNGSFEGVPIGSYSLVLLVEDYGMSSIFEDIIEVTVNKDSFSGSGESNYYGGVVFDITYDNKTFTLPDDITIKICGNKGSIQSIDGETISVLIPPIQSLEMLENGQIPLVYQVLTGGSSNDDAGGAGSLVTDTEVKGEAYFLTDNSTSTYYYSTNSICYVGIRFSSNHQFIGSTFSFYIPADFETNKFDGVEIQLSSDGAIWKTVLTLGFEDIISGWNVFSWEEDIEADFYGQYIRIYDDDGESHCYVTDISLTGVIFVKESALSIDEDYTTECSVTLELNDEEIGTLKNVQVFYVLGNNYTVESLSQTYSQNKGGAKIELSFDKEVTTDEVPSVYFWGVAAESCSWVDTQTLSCTTGQLEKVMYEKQVEVLFSFGFAFTTDLTFYYYSLWSDPNTWGGESPGITDTEVIIEKGWYIVLDEDTNVLSSITVEGDLMFNQGTNLTLNTKAFVITNGGSLRIGFPSSPRTASSQAKIVLHKNTGEANFADMAIYCNDGQINLYGNRRDPVFTYLAETAEIGTTTIKLISPVDWVQGETIVIAPSSHDYYEAEEREISFVSKDGFSVSFETGLEFEHFSYSENFNGTDYNFKTEVALLTRSIVIEPDDLSQGEGPKIIVTENCKAEMSGIQVKNGGKEEFGGNAISFVRIVSADDSFLKNSVVSSAYGMGAVIRHSYFVSIVENIFYNLVGGAVVLETGFEQFNNIQNNLAILVEETQNYFFMQNYEGKAAFLTKNPLNKFEGNIVAGSARNGFHYDLDDYLSSDGLIACPSGMSLGSFQSNTAHSCSMDGLHIAPSFDPKRNSCEGYSSSNSFQPNIFYSFVGFKNVERGVFVEEIGNVSFVNFTLVENGLAEFDVENPIYDSLECQSRLEYSLLVGVSKESPGDKSTSQSAIGFYGPMAHDFYMSGIIFANFFSDRSAISTCSQCIFYDESTSATILITSSLSFEDAPNKVFWSQTSRDIIKDEDGTLTSNLGGGWVTPYFVFNFVDGCLVNLEEYGGLVCNSSVEFLNVKFYDVERSLNFEDSDLVLVMLDGPFQNISTVDESKFESVKGSESTWDVPLVANSVYNLHFDNGIDMETLKFVSEVSETHPYSQVFFQFNFTSNRESVSSSGTAIYKEYFPYYPSSSFLETGDYSIDEKGENVVVVLSLKKTNYDTTEEEEEYKTYMEADKCQGVCGLTENIQTYEEMDWRYWSDPESWTDGKVPGDGSRVIIKINWKMMLDVEDTGDLEYLEIKGSLYVSEDFESVRIASKMIYLRENAQFIVGTSSSKFEKELKIELLGEKETTGYTIGKSINGNSKLFVVSGKSFILFGL